MTPPDPDNPLPVGSGAGEKHSEPITIGGADSHPDRWVDSSGPHPDLNPVSVHSLVRGTNSAGHPAYFKFRARTGRKGSPAGCASLYLSTLDWDLTIPQELYGLDPQEGDLTHSMQGAPVIVARGAFTGPDGLDERGRSLSAQALSLIRAAIKHGSMHHAFCRSAVAAPEGPPREHLPGPDLQSQLRATSRQNESALTREALRKIITAEASRRMPEGPALVRALLEK